MIDKGILIKKLEFCSLYRKDKNYNVYKNDDSQSILTLAENKKDGLYLLCKENAFHKNMTEFYKYEEDAVKELVFKTGLGKDNSKNIMQSLCMGLYEIEDYSVEVENEISLLVTRYFKMWRKFSEEYPENNE